MARVFSMTWPFMMWSILYFVINFWLEWRREQERAVKATLLAQKAQLQMLRYQLNPHFLFNALNSVRALVDENQESARAMITELAEFLRYSLCTGTTPTCP
jgi:LytS/YehU family sensor histidine kinase